MRVGSDAHKRLFCRHFLESHARFEPAALPWPELDAPALARVRGIPFWQEVLHTEQRAIAVIEAFVRTVGDPLVREAIELMGDEEHRHERLVRELIRRYGIAIDPPPLEPVPESVEREFIEFGYGECVDGFLGFGLFKIARGSGFLPTPLFDIFEILMDEELRHVVLFTNWMAYREAQHGRGAAPLRALTAARHYERSIASKVRIVLRNARHEGDGQRFNAMQATDFLEGFTPRALVEACVTENARRVAGLPRELRRPLLLPVVARAALALMNAGAAVRRLRTRPAADTPRGRG